METIINTDKISGLQFEDIDNRDSPKYCDAFISAGQIDDRDLTDDEIDQLNSNSIYSDFKLTELYNFIY